MKKGGSLEMADVVADSDLLYDLHHALDPVILPVANRVLKLAFFSKARQHFEWDMLNDIGIINLLRRDYLRHGSFVRTFRLYQDTRLDNRSHRYESLFALLVVTVVGAVIAGVILESYKDNKNRVAKWIREMKSEANLFGIQATVVNIFDIVYRKRRRIRLLEKFCSSDADKLIADFRIITKCYVARQMHDSALISYKEYAELVNQFLKKRSLPHQGPLAQKFYSYLHAYTANKDHIDPDKVFLAIRAYGKGTIAQKLDSVGAKLHLPQNKDSANVFHGLAASPGAVAGISYVFGKRRQKTNHPFILVVDEREFTADHIHLVIHLLESCAGVVTTNTGMTGHIPVISRGMGKGCVALSFENFSQIRNGDTIALSGETGIVATGVLVELS
jgi:phosphohistidine swiveling domain-containing protein